MLHSLSKDNAFTGETAPRHTFLCSDLQCLPPGDPINPVRITKCPITGKSFISQKWHLTQTQVYDKTEVLRPVYFLMQQNLWALFFACCKKSR